jgi:hypothetical protein|tara:strand:+ start:10627 stop:10857 length:231 start_codon:yes stop_codon:yes gene_type:complete
MENTSPLDASQIDMSQTTKVVCEKCSGLVFEQGLMLRKLSRLVSPNGQEVLIPIAVFMCKNCNHINSDFVESDLEI